MGAVVALVGGVAELVTSTNQATVFGILLHDVNTAGANPNGSVARRGSYKAASLVVSAGVNGATLETALRDIGILLEGRFYRSCGFGYGGSCRRRARSPSRQRRIAGAPPPRGRRGTPPPAEDNPMALRLSVNLLERGKFLEAGEIVPGDFHEPAWVVARHRLTEEEGVQLCEDRRRHREQVAQRKAEAEARVASGNAAPASRRNPASSG